MGSEALPTVGDVIAGKYKIARVIGVGGMGVVVEAEHLELGRPVALKFLRPDAAADTGAAERFLREARAAVRIRSQHVARVLDVGREGVTPFMVMEYLDGRDLGQVIAVDAPLPVAQAIGYLLQACEALAEAHVLGIVHRDLKPSNIFVSAHADGTALVKVLDFGISKGGKEVLEGSLTTTGVILGSPLYMSPEQLRSTRAVDSRTDIWSLGVVLYELLTRKRPFEADTMPALCAMIAADPPRPLRGHGIDFPAKLEEAISRCLEKKPADRFRTVGQLALALLPFAGPEGLASVQRTVRVTNSNETTAASASDSLAVGRSVSPPLRRRRVTLGAIGILGGAVAVGFLLRHTTGSPSPSPLGSTRENGPLSVGARGAHPSPPPDSSSLVELTAATPESPDSTASSKTTPAASSSIHVVGRSVPPSSTDVLKPKPKPSASSSAPAASPSSHPHQGEVLDPLVDQR